jgi:hypothetical protein
VHISKDRKTGRRTNPFEGCESGLDPRATDAINIRPIGLIETRFKDDSARHVLSQPRKRLTNTKVERVILKLTGTGNKEEAIRWKKRRGHDCAK